MALIQSQAKAPGTGGRAQFVGMALTVAVLIVAAAMVAVLASSLTAKSTGGSIVTTKADPLVQQGAIQFRAAEHAAGAAAVDPLLQHGAIQFRAAEQTARRRVVRSAPPAERDPVPCSTSTPPADALLAQGRRPGEHPAGVGPSDLKTTGTTTNERGK